jgi:squalene-associated FAD-dependent desaturase
MNPTGRPARKIAVVGAGWAGLAAAVEAVRRDAQVTLYEMAHEGGGRARRVHTNAGDFDNGQHILIGAYSATLALMRRVGADPQSLLLRQPLALIYPDGKGLRLPTGAPMVAFVRAVAGAQGWGWAHRLALLRAAAGWMLKGFDCDPRLSVQQLCADLPAAVLQDLVEPLCVAALNTPAEQASARVFLRVLHDALFAGRGSADLLLPTAPLSTLLPDPAWAWLLAAGAQCRAGWRVQSLQREGAAWRLDGEAFDGVVLACSAKEAARLITTVDPRWADQAAALRYEPIVTAYLADASLRLPQAMLSLRTGDHAPAQFVFDLGLIGTHPGRFAFVVSGAAPWLSQGLAACGQAVLQQARSAFAGAFMAKDALQHLSAERRATFACTPGLERPPMAIAPALVAAGDYIAGAYPATLEGAVRSGVAAAQALT